MLRLRYGFITLVFIFFSFGSILKAQDVSIQTDSVALSTAPDSIPGLEATADSLSKNDTLIYKSDVETRVDYEAKDSIVFNLVTNDIYLYGETSITYGHIGLTAAETSINWNTKIMEAHYLEDSTGRKVGKPVFTEKEESYEASEMTYNFQTKKAFINGIITQQGEAYMQGQKVKKSGEELYITDAKYTTCNLADPHFHIAAKKLKVIPGNKVISGPFNLAFREIKTPLGFIFGMFPQPEKNVSGVIIPSYGEQRNQGFFLRGGGYYLKFNEYIDARVTGDIYTSGAWGVRINSNYKKRYAYNGGINFDYNVLRQFSVIENSGPQSFGFSLGWRHTPQNYGSSRFSSSVDIRTNSYNRTTNLAITDIQRSIESTLSSSINYSKTFRNTPFSMTSTLRHRQNLAKGTVDVLLPDVAFNTKRQFPFKKIKSLEKGVLGKLGFSHNFSGKNALSNGPKPKVSGITQTNRTALDDSLISFNSENLPLLFERAQIGGIHRIPISTSFNLFKFFTVSPGASYTEVWYPKELRYSDYDSIEDGHVVEEIAGFSRSGWYNFSTSMSTRLYGFVYFNKGKIKAIRHVMNPSVSFSYSPDFSDPDRRNSAYQRVIGKNGEVLNLSKYAGFTFGGPAARENANLSFGITNNLEMKVASKKDTITGTKKVSIFDNLSFNSGYDLLADSFNLRDISISAATSLFNKKLRLSTGGTLNPYTYVLDGDEFNSRGERNSGREIDQLKWFNGQGIGQIQSWRVSLSTSFSSSKGKKKNLETPRENPAEQAELDYILQNPEDYIDFNIPWSLSLNYNISYSKRGFSEGKLNTNSLQANGNFSLTKNTKVTFSSGYNIQQKLIQPTNIGIIRDLHCWSLSFNVVPFGTQQSFNLRINAKSSVLQDLKLEKRRSWLDN